MKEILKEYVYKEGLEKLLTRMTVILSEYELRKLTQPVIVSATIVDMEAVRSKIQTKWRGFNIKDISIDINKQTIEFKVYGHCWIPSSYRSFILMDWSNVQDETHDYYHEVTEEHAEQNCMRLLEFINSGIKIEMV